MGEVWPTAHIIELQLTTGLGPWNGDEHRPHGHRTVKKRRWLLLKLQLLLKLPILLLQSSQLSLLPSMRWKTSSSLWAMDWRRSVADLGGGTVYVFWQKIVGTWKTDRRMCKIYNAAYYDAKYVNEGAIPHKRHGALTWCSSPFLWPLSPYRWIDHWVRDAWPVRRQTYGYLPCCRASPPFDHWYQIILLGEQRHACEQLAHSCYLVVHTRRESNQQFHDLVSHATRIVDQ